MRLSKLKSSSEELYASFSSLGVRKIRTVEQFQKALEEYYHLALI